MNRRKIVISWNRLANGIAVDVDSRKYMVTYPVKVWNSFPQEIRDVWADNLTYAWTAYLALKKQTPLEYDFPLPLGEAFFFQGLNYSLPETMTLTDRKTKLSGLIGKLYNANLNITFSPRHLPRQTYEGKAKLKNQAIIPFSFGKDSLLTFALCREMGIRSYPFFFLEPSSPWENEYKKSLATKFKEEFQVKITRIPMPLGKIRDNYGAYWGWDLTFTQYSLLMLPYIFNLKTKYVFWSHEQDCNELFNDDYGYKVNLVYEQSSRWLNSLNSLFQGLGQEVRLSSIIEPINEFATIWVLHKRYPEIAKYQYSCFAEEKSQKNKRWCGRCEKCMMMNIFMLAMGVDPRSVGLNEDLFTASKRQYYILFRGKESKFWVSDKIRDLWWQEQLLAFLMAYRKGAKGVLMEEFKKKFLGQAEKMEKDIRKKVFGMTLPKTVDESIFKSLKGIYEEELKGLI